MKIIPAIDLINGKCVRLYQGDFSKTTEVGSDPESQLLRFIQDGAEMIHIVDLDGARAGKPKQYELINKLCSLSNIPIEVGGGIRDIETIDKYVSIGVSRIVLGTAALEREDFLKEALDKYNQYIVIGIDAIKGKVATRGWETVSEIEYIGFAKKMESLGVQTIVYTDISKDGTLTGPNLKELKQISNEVSCNIVASGGIRNMEDLQEIKKIGITEAIVGKAIYDGQVKLIGERV
ncbi:1-(5-phosphoribosyl)-5-[(5-phosphoribosylamino)methylideneamino]imidazole-4-carboxamide isomerase [Heyndrickxia sporothermodurans]|uniref:1-(5-phosphoribosyl)-5-[(5-phosphoribosylamino)methylideneamino] imidazole-4-carboxamide isomerase n=1 Tax=Heyndrickxia sporothermodurans TaxID=46224 RepID=A0A150L822_9BACI|nr:1-(5-phosphoribosyl)-5-[(5-phosphoribosylamino)methylideneamino]imidazole-4-carboxamide isomerase [Heyndrickxia sporothermodurans]KYD08467.1 Phosphoribosylformimino-5-aminoimidazole carboxamide ribotide isomerase [Heyndrickxia sporothermodurans]MBL5767398.1 1-(5-phosphoribosyl)-5-[(5-phosphoribosylamino)methylideneamino]imidazole-4-carboxamide isomerase [Heyndrickxia sporothermodurans]MBL5770748.1 1-(5-phosphoribosyl)-5-[(5-phosphoribosylamino)methylideneamino]imidazole-4-carboxamide isomeras